MLPEQPLRGVGVVGVEGSVVLGAIVVLGGLAGIVVLRASVHALGESVVLCGSVAVCVAIR
jgi:hypothetical protein